MKKKVFERFSLEQIKRERARRIRRKRSEDYEYLEGVFDKPTLLTIYKFLNDGVISEFNGVINAGKESKVYHAISPGGRELAVKIFNTGNLEFRKSISKYIVGDPRFEVRRTSSGLIQTWAFKEFTNLKALFTVGLRVPEPVAVRRNVLMMVFLGKNGIRAPLLKEAELADPRKVYAELVDFIKRSYSEGELVHGDLSEYNVMYFEGHPFVIDVSQAVSIEHPLAKELLDRDIEQINKYFSELGVKIFDKDQIKGDLGL